MRGEKQKKPCIACGRPASAKLCSPCGLEFIKSPIFGLASDAGLNEASFEVALALFVLTKARTVTP